SARLGSMYTLPPGAGYRLPAVAPASMSNLPCGTTQPESSTVGRSITARKPDGPLQEGGGLTACAAGTDAAARAASARAQNIRCVLNDVSLWTGSKLRDFAGTIGRP